jgi:hypothetical protein
MFLGHSRMSTIKVIFILLPLSPNHISNTACIVFLSHQLPCWLPVSQRPLSGANQYTKAPPSTSPDWLATLSCHLLQLHNTHLFLLALFDPEDKSTAILQNSRNNLSNSTAAHPIRLGSSTASCLQC